MLQRGYRERENRGAKRRGGEAEPSSPAGDIEQLRHTHAHTNGERKEGERRQAAEEGMARREKGREAKR